MSRQTRNKNLGKNHKKTHKKTGGGKPSADSGWNPDKQGTNRGKNQRENKRDSRPNKHENWIWGYHGVKAALENPKRTHHKLYITRKTAEKLGVALLVPLKNNVFVMHPGDIDDLLQNGAVHQGAALLSAPLPAYDLQDIAEPATGMIVVLDQITDPHNVGAMFRLAAAFGAKAIIMQTRNAPPLAGAVTKVAVGTVETVPHVLVTNIANTLLDLQKTGWRVTGLAGEAKITLEQAFINAEAEVIVMGAEGPGLRKRVRDCCDQLAKIPMPGSEKSGAESLNVSTAAGIALYEAVRGLGVGVG